MVLAFFFTDDGEVAASGFAFIFDAATGGMTPGARGGAARNAARWRRLAVFKNCISAKAKANSNSIRFGFEPTSVVRTMKNDILQQAYNKRCGVMEWLNHGDGGGGGSVLRTSSRR